ncbi:MAG: paraquat-inducible protein A [Phycisphaeraceae bacterium]
MSIAYFSTRLMLCLASVLLGLGLVAPCMTIQPSMGQPWDSWLRLLEPSELEPKTYSILGGILELMRTDSLALGILLLAFSVVFPAFKLATLWWAVSVMKHRKPTGPALWVTHHGGKFSMLDVMVVAVFIVAIKGLPGETTVTIGWGLFAFAAAVILSIIASLQVKRLEQSLVDRDESTLEGAS